MRRSIIDANEVGLNVQLRSARGLPAAEHHPYVSAVLTGLGYVYTIRKQYLAAADCLGRALEIRQTVFGPASPKVAGVLFAQSTLMRRLHRQTEAKAPERRAIEIVSAHACENRLGRQIDISMPARRNQKYAAST